jgi:uncharacterized membrane protein YdjX (TVP38/TMEM64 family)
MRLVCRAKHGSHGERWEHPITPANKRLRLGVALGTLAVLGLLVWGGVIEADPAAWRDQLAEAGPLGCLGFVVGFSLLQGTALVSVYIWLLVAAAVWTPPVAIALSWLGAMGSSLFSFGLARTLGREAVLARLPAWGHRLDSSLSRRSFWAVLALRSTTHVMFPVQILYGVSGVRFVPFVAGTALGLLPPIAFVIFFAAEVSSAVLPALAVPS